MRLKAFLMSLVSLGGALVLRGGRVLDRVQCQQSRTFAPPTAEPWVDQLTWPQFLLTNEAHFAGRTSLEGAASFLLQTRQGVVLATAAHLTGEPGGVLPPLTRRELVDAERFGQALERWWAFPRTRPRERVAGLGLAAPSVHRDWLLLKAGPVPSSLRVLQLADEVPRVGSRVFLVGCEYAERDCVQAVRVGQVTAMEDGLLRYSVVPPMDPRGFSGGPLLDARGHVVGVFSQRHLMKVDAEGLALEAESDPSLVVDALACAASAR